MLKAPPGLQVGVVHKKRDEKGNLLGVKTYARLGRLKDIRQRTGDLEIGRKINTSHLERLNGTIRSRSAVADLARRTRNGSRLEYVLQCGLWLWGDLYNWMRRQGSLAGQTPAVATRLTQHVWTVVENSRYPVHISDFQREDWAERRKSALESALDARNRKKTSPTSRGTTQRPDPPDSIKPNVGPAAGLSSDLQPTQSQQHQRHHQGCS